jgi:hypothetical protein
MPCSGSTGDSYAVRHTPIGKRPYNVYQDLPDRDEYHHRPYSVRENRVNSPEF